MKLKLINLFTSCILLIVISLTSCKKKSDRTFDIFTVQSDDVTLQMDGTINKNSKECFDDLIKQYPNITTINIVNCDGSSDDEVNLQLSKEVHSRGINTHLLDDASIASGGVDFFLAGIKRTRDNNTKIGVHSWSDGNNSATDFSVGHSNHLPYIDYYKSVGFTQQEAEDFYYFTINAAPASSIHWMTDTEIIQYKMLNQ